MRRRALVTMTILGGLLGFLSPANGAYLHYMDCQDCHKSGVTIQTLNPENVCLGCHGDPPVSWTFNDSVGHLSGSGFQVGDASNAMGTYPASQTPVRQNSHMWAAPKDVVPAAGAVAPSDPLFGSRYGVSTGKVTCSRCHNPHGDPTNPKLLRLGVGTADAMCRDCHRQRQLPNRTVATDPNTKTHGLGTHPMVADYQAVASRPENIDKFNYPMDATKAGAMALLPGNAISCTTCHGVHFVDSKSATADGPGTTNTGDGMLLKANGPSLTGATSVETAQLRSDLCQACHTYQTHGTIANSMGCLDCHGGHSYDADNPTQPNYYILKASIGDYKTPTTEWFNGGGTGFCQGCHDGTDAPVIPVDGSGKHMGLTSGDQTVCAQCHGHDNVSGSFLGSCNACHGYAPDQNDDAVRTRSYAIDPDKTISNPGDDSYKDAGNGFKDESTTPHIAHADTLGVGAAGNYKFNCLVCHGPLTKHRDGNYQDVPFETLAKTGMVGTVYSSTGNGSCSNIYCHSNGGKRTGDGPTRSYQAVSSASLPWATGIGTITTCTACHGNDVATMVTSGKNSAVHEKHLAKYGNNCAICHSLTATSNVALATGAIGGDHVDGQVDVSFKSDFSLGAGTLGSGSYGDTNGTCSVYCHSNGTTPATPDWDSAASGACGTCHQAVTATDPGPALGGSHAKHIFDVNGPQLACDVCHTHNGSGNDHVNKGLINIKTNLQTTVCNPCHGVDGAETAPTWGSAATSDCNTCHSGTTQSSFTNRFGTAFSAATTANAKTSFLDKGHGLPSGQYPVTSKNAAAKVCTSCHDKDAAGHFDADDTDLRLLQGVGGFPADYAANKNAFCGNASCHGTTVAMHQTKACIACHDPHGSANIAMIYRSQAVQNAKDTSGTGEFSSDVVFTAFSAADSFDELDGIGSNTDDICATCHTATSHNNRVADPAIEHNSGDKRGTNCTLCHQHPKAFLPVGNSCADCHGNAPTAGAHEVHFKKLNDSSAEDRSDCALCHTGANLYTYDIGADQSSGTPGRQNHAKGQTTQENTLTASVGYVVANQTCATACHQSTVTDGAWSDANGLNCDACHYYAADPTSAGNNAYTFGALSATHNKHFDVTIDALTCADCHGTLDAQGAGPLAHKDANDTTTDALWLQTQGKTYATDADVNDSANNGGSNSWVAADNTCATRMCHDPSGAGKIADWDLTNSQACNFCHNSTTAPGTGSHAVHMSIDTLYGKGNTCQNCHPSVGVDLAHRSGSVEFTGTMGYTGNTSDYTNTTWGTCGTGSCHNNGAGAAPVVAVTWGSAQAATCALCHAQTPTTGAHSTHLAATVYGPNPSATTACNQCHAANANNTSMAGKTNHLNAKVTFADNLETTAGTINANTTVTSCNTCHGGLTAANAASGAKQSWAAATRLACGTCHGSYTLANSKADGTGVTAPNNAGTTYNNFGHGKGGVAKACGDCHDSSVAHISGALNDTNRLKDITGVSYASNPNGYCEVCHNTASFNPSTHYLNTQTAGGASVDANQCNICHNPHGSLDKNSTGLATMLKRTIGGKEVVSFTDKTVRGSYFRATPSDANGYGICQVCHDPVEVSYFNRTTADDAGHNSGSVCISCHKHDNTETAFKASCNGCHGSTVTGQYWPYGSGGSVPAANDQVGRHQKHVEVLASRLYGQSVAQLLADPATGNKQKAICAYCHATPGGDADHGQTLPADTTFHPIWDVAAADADATHVAGNCSNIDCHNNQATGTGTYGWYDAGLSACAMCHASNITTTGTHNEHLKTGSTYYNDGRIGCTDCHASGTAWATNPPSTNHINGAMNATGYDAGAKTCGTNVCHNDGKGNAAAVTPTWGVANASACNFCHNNSSEGHNGHFAADGVIVAAGTMSSCTACHTHSGPNAAHFDGTVSLVAGLAYSGDVAVAPASGYGTCTTSTCHTDGKGAQVETPAWNSTGAACVLCHGVATNGVPNTGSHTQHVEGNPVISSYTAQGLTTTQTEYKFNCTACHGSTLANHINNNVNVVVANWTPQAAGDTCGQNSCHQDGKNGPPAGVSATWGTPFAGDRCAKCHGNSPATGAHDVHAVGIHSSDIYTGTTGLVLDDATRANAHKDVGTLTIIGCSVCHYNTVRAWNNDLNPVCATCHNGALTDSTPANGVSPNGNAQIYDKATHLDGDGTGEVSFMNMAGTFKTRSQIRDDVTTVPELANSWTRINNYKAGANSYDQAKRTPTIGLDKTCSTVDCHNGIQTEPWTTAPVSRSGCVSCHKELP